MKRKLPLTLCLLATSLASALALTACGPEDDPVTAAGKAQATQAAEVAAATPAPAATPAASTHRSAPMVAQHTTAAPARTTERAPVVVGELGTITAVVPQYHHPRPSGAGAVIGGVLGGVLGHQVGGGDGRKIATVAGALGGAYAGNQVEKNRSSELSGYRIDVKLDDGRTEGFTLQQSAGFTTGQRVRIVDGQIRPA